MQWGWTIRDSAFGHSNRTDIDAHSHLGTYRTEDELGTTSADVHNERRDCGGPERRTFECETGLLVTRDQLGAMAERCFGAIEELLAVDRVPTGGGGDDPDALSSEVGDPLPEAGEYLDGSAHRLLAQPPLPIDALSQPGDSRVPLHLVETPVDLVGDEEPHRVGSDVNGCDPHWKATLPGLDPLRVAHRSSWPLDHAGDRAIERLNLRGRHLADRVLVACRMVGVVGVEALDR